MNKTAAFQDANVTINKWHNLDVKQSRLEWQFFLGPRSLSQKVSPRKIGVVQTFEEVTQLDNKIRNHCRVLVLFLTTLTQLQYFQVMSWQWARVQILVHQTWWIVAAANPTRIPTKSHDAMNGMLSKFRHRIVKHLVISSVSRMTEQEMSFWNYYVSKIIIKHETNII